MTSKRDSRWGGSSRRDVLRQALGLGSAALGASAFGHAARAQTEAQWWETILGHGSSLDTQRTEARNEAIERRRSELDDLREGKTPWRSDVMIENISHAIERYEQLVARGGWPQVPGNRMMRPGDDDERVPALRQRLRATGELGPSRYSYESFGYDAELEQAVARFQARHGLRVRGRVDRPTLAALNIAADMRLAQLRLNQKRIRDLLHGPADPRYVLVNVPAFQLEAVENFEVQRRHRVIAGRPTRETPEIHATIKALNFMPYWRVPGSVARMDLVPRLKKDPKYLEKEHIRALLDSFDGQEIDPGQVNWDTADMSRIHFRQDPGEWNALGLVRIDMPNEHIVYMHDTPMKNLFDQASRAYSAGCVRVQGVMDFAEWIASKELGWEQPGRSAAIVEARQELTLELTHPIPVYFTYITAWAEADGSVHFRPDIYDRDGSRVFAGDIDPDEPAPPETLTP